MRRYRLFLVQCVTLVSLSAAQPRVGVGVLAGIQTAFNDFDGGKSVQVTLLYRVSEYVRLSLTSGYLSWQRSSGGGFDVIPFLAGVRIQTSEADDIVPYGKAKIGLYSARTTISLPSLVAIGSPSMRPDTMGFPEPINTHPVSGFPSRSSTTTFGYDLGIGVALALSEQWSLDLGASVYYLDRTTPDTMMPDVLYLGRVSSTSRYFTVFTVGVFFHL